MQLILILAGAIVILSTVVYIIGYFSPRNYRNKITEDLDAGVKKIWDYLTDFENKNSKRRGIKKVEILEYDDNGFPLKFKEITDAGGYISFKVIEKADFKKLHIRIIKSSFDMTGDWIYTLESNGSQTKLNIDETTQIDKLPIRAIMTIVGRNKNIKNELKNIKKYIATMK